VDVVQWRDDIGQFIAEALGPAKVKEVHIDEETKTADVVVSEHQLSLAIGKEGQNARLAARLSGYKVDIRSDMEGVEVEEAVPEGAPTDQAPVEAEAPVDREAVVSEEAVDEVSVEEAVDTAVPASDDEAAVAAVDNADDESE
jgi:N utilization substance protein A